MHEAKVPFFCISSHRACCKPPVRCKHPQTATFILLCSCDTDTQSEPIHASVRQTKPASWIARFPWAGQTYPFTMKAVKRSVQRKKVMTMRSQCQPIYSPQNGKHSRKFAIPEASKNNWNTIPSTHCAFCSHIDCPHHQRITSIEESVVAL